MFVHPNYRPPLTYHDIALIKVDRKINLSKSVMPACLPQAKHDLLRNISGQIFTASGFGVTGAGGTTTKYYIYNTTCMLMLTLTDYPTQYNLLLFIHLPTRSCNVIYHNLT